MNAPLQGECPGQEYANPDAVAGTNTVHANQHAATPTQSSALPFGSVPEPSAGDQTVGEPTLRERTVRWCDPAIVTQQSLGLSGIEVIRGIANGDLAPPPVASLLGFTVRSATPGRVVASFTANESHYNMMGTVHGGVTATLLDTVMGCAVHTLLPVGRGYTTLNISVHYVRPITTATGDVVAEADVQHAGRSTAIAHGRIFDAQGRLLATGETTCLLFDAPPTPADPHR